MRIMKKEGSRLVAYFRIYFLQMHIKKTMTVNKKIKYQGPPYFNYLSNECLLA
jgi:hypothetical protein